MLRGYCPSAQPLNPHSPGGLKACTSIYSWEPLQIFRIRKNESRAQAFQLLSSWLMISFAARVLEGGLCQEPSSVHQWFSISSKDQKLWGACSNTDCWALYPRVSEGRGGVGAGRENLRICMSHKFPDAADLRSGDSFRTILIIQTLPAYYNHGGCFSIPRLGP